ncbi:MAG: aminotransferase class III-fold pyridoxal phosphate-dependent enzyme [Candidatus Marinimicrobia bacterium]|nr:aminotransferase class III-fold pyridoxal phosphate-dependent enzyme [Candidatus Neomarinimicrobiota bacterium]
MNKLLQKEFGFKQVEIKKLNGYDNLNYLVNTEAGKYIFKTYLKDTESLARIEAENEILIALQNPLNDKFPRPIQFTDGSFVKCIEIGGKATICRMLSYLKGQCLADAPQSKSLFQSLGTFLAQMDIELQSCNNYTIKARQWEWNIEYLYLNKKYIADIARAKNRSLVNYFFQQFEENVAPALPDLRKTMIHNDANEWNVLVNNGKVTGIIDFGDLAYIALINELAVAIAYACFDKENPLGWASIILKSYHQVLPIKENEIAVLYYLVAARLCISVCNSAHSRKNNPNNEYAFISENSAWKLLYQWLRINPIAAENCFRSAIGLTAEKPQSIDSLIKARHKVISPILSLSYSKPIYMIKAAFQYMYDAYGNTYLDAYNNIPHVRHSHPQVVAAAKNQIAKLNTNTRYLYDLLPEYAERLLAKFPTSLNKVYFVNSDSAASDLAIRLAQAHTGYKNLMVIEHGYHGNTQLGVDISDYKFSNQAGQGQKDHIIKTAIPDTYRGKYTTNNGNAGKMYAREAIDEIKRSDSPMAAFISESILGCARQVPLAKGYLKEIYPAIRQQGGVCISDEVQTGFGRLGDYFWGFETQAVIPDIVIIGKPMGNGHPMGAVITTTEIANSFNKGVEFFSSFGGNPVSCTIGLAVLNVIEEEKLQENAQIVGEFYKSLFSDLQKEFTCIGDVRGSGLFIGVEIVKNSTSLEPDSDLSNLIKNELRNRNILISTDGPFDSVLKTKPPLCFTKANAHQVTDHIYGILKTY